MYQVDLGHQRCVSSVTTVAVAKAAVACPDGNDELLPVRSPPPKAEVVGIVHARVARPLPPGESLDHVGDARAHDDRFRAVQPEIGDAIEVPDAPDAVHRDAGDERPRTAEKVERLRGATSSLVELRFGLANLVRDLLVEGPHGGGAGDEGAEDERIGAREERRAMRGVGGRRCDGQRRLRARGDGRTERDRGECHSLRPDLDRVPHASQPRGETRARESRRAASARDRA